MNESSWLQRFFAFEASNGGALPSPQLFPFYAESLTTPTNEIDADAASTTSTLSNSGSDSAKSASPDVNVAVSEVHSNAAAAQDENSSSSRASTPPPPPPVEPPPPSAITNLRNKVVRVKDVGCGTTSPNASLDHCSTGDFPLIYSRHVFLHSVTALQLLWGYFSLALWNYSAHIRWYGTSFVRLTLVDATSAVAATAAGVAVSVPAARSNDDDLYALLDRFSTQWLAPAYLAFGLAGLTYTVSAVVYVCIVNTPCHVRAAWPHPQLLMKACCLPAAASRSSARQRGYSHKADESDEDPFTTYGPLPRKVKHNANLLPAGPAEEVQRRRSIGVYMSTTPPTAPSMPAASQPTDTSSALPLSFTQPQFLFPLRRLNVLDREAAAAVVHKNISAPSTTPYPSDPSQLAPSPQQQQQQVFPAGVPYMDAPSSSLYPSPFPRARPPFPPSPHYLKPPTRPSSQRQQRQHRGDPKAALLWCAAPLVVLLVILDFLVVRGCRVRGLPIRFIQGLTPALGLTLLLYTLKSVVVLCVRCCCKCCAVMPIVVYQPAQQAPFQQQPQMQPQQHQTRPYYPVEM